MTIGPFPTDPAFLSPETSVNQLPLSQRMSFIRQQFPQNFTGERWEPVVVGGPYDEGQGLPSGVFMDPTLGPVRTVAPGREVAPQDLVTPTWAQPPRPSPLPPDIEGYRPTSPPSRPGVSGLAPGAAAGGGRSFAPSGPRAPGSLAGFRPAFPRGYRGLLRSPYAQYAGWGQQPLASPQYGRFQPEFDDFDEEELRRALMGEAPDSPAFMTGIPL